MHAAYSFLISGDTKETALSCFEEYSERHCDENNWSQPVALILEGGDVINCASSGDLRGRDHFVGNSNLLEMCERVRFDWAKKFALECVVADMLSGISGSEFGDENASLAKEDKEQSYGDIIASIMRDVPPVLARMYAGFKLSTEGFDMEGYSRMKLSEQFELFLKADCKPFTTYPVSPDDYRCHDLRDDRDSESSILVVDIHT